MQNVSFFKFLPGLIVNCILTWSFDYNHNIKSYDQWMSNKEIEFTQNWTEIHKNWHCAVQTKFDRNYSLLLTYCISVFYATCDMIFRVPSPTPMCSIKRAVIHISLKGLPRLSSDLKPDNLQYNTLGCSSHRWSKYYFDRLKIKQWVAGLDLEHLTWKNMWQFLRGCPKEKSH